jgi:hypothetical protein
MLRLSPASYPGEMRIRERSEGDERIRERSERIRLI